MSPPGGQRILVVEDDPEIRHLLCFVLDEDDREVVTAESGEEALRMLDERATDLVVLDLILPDVDGRSLLTGIRARRETAGVPVVVVSARGGSEIRHDCFELGADLFHEKPFDPDELADEVAALLSRVAEGDPSTGRDPATGLLNRAGLAETVPTPDTGYAAAILQLDGFLRLSERWGWSEGERMLRELLSGVGATVSGGAPLARLGGGELGFVLPETALVDPVEAAQGLLDRIQSQPVEDPEGEALRFTASVGVAAVDPGTDLEDALDVARRRLHRARDAGGNRVYFEDFQAAERAGRILVAEDDQISSTILLHRLQKEGLDIVLFDNGKDAYEHALEETPSLVILDVKMPGMDGFEVLERLRRTPSYASVPIILLTSMGSEADVVRGFQLGADDYILKPFSPIELSARVWRLLRRGRSAAAV